MSRFEFKLPDIGEGVTEGEIVGWLVQVGEPVGEDQDMVEVMTDKATVTIGAPRSGKVVELRGAEGDVVPVGAVLVVLETDVTPALETGTASNVSGAEVASPAAVPTASAVGDLKEDLPGVGAPDGAGGSDYFSERPMAAPATRKLARELGVDLRHVRPTGGGARVTREDVERHAAGAGSAAGRIEVDLPVDLAPTIRQSPTVHEATTLRPGSPEPPPVKPLPQGGRSADRGADEERVPIRGLRRRIFENMARSKHTAAHFTYVDECDVTALKEFRARAKAHAERYGVSLTYLPFIVKSVVAALRAHPALNAWVDDEKREIVRRNRYDIGIAVATDAGLTVPVLRDADTLSMLDMQQEITRLSTEARDGKTRREDLGGSSFTITSLGRLGGLFATPVVNYPEVAILGVHEMKRRPVVRGDEIVVGEVMLLSLSFDHRVIDGHVGAAFAREVIDYLEQPDRLLVELR